MTGPDLYVTVRHCGRTASDAGLAAIVRACLAQAEGAIDLLCYCHQAAGPVWEAPCAKLRAELGLAAMVPLAFGQSGCLSFPHALTMTEWLLAAGAHRGALIVIAERPGEGRSGRVQVAVVEASTARGAYRVVRGPEAAPELWLATRTLASEPFHRLKSGEPTLAAGTVVALAFGDGDEAQTVILEAAACSLI